MLYLKFIIFIRILQFKIERQIEKYENICKIILVTIESDNMIIYKEFISIYWFYNAIFCYKVLTIK